MKKLFGSMLVTVFLFVASTVGAAMVDFHYEALNVLDTEFGAFEGDRGTFSIDFTLDSASLNPPASGSQRLDAPAMLYFDDGVDTDLSTAFDGFFTANENIATRDIASWSGNPVSLDGYARQIIWTGYFPENFYSFDWFADGLIDTIGRDVRVGIAGQSGTYNYYAMTGTASVAPVPEPSTLLLLSGGLAGLAFYARRRRKE